MKRSNKERKTKFEMKRTTEKMTELIIGLKKIDIGNNDTIEKHQ